MAKYTKGQKPENIWARGLRERIEAAIAGSAPKGITLRVEPKTLELLESAGGAK